MQVALAVLILGIIVIGWIISAISETASNTARNQQRKKELEQKWSHRQIDRSKNLFDRNQDIIDKHLNKISVGYQRSYYIENIVRDCVQDIAEAEGMPNLGPNHQYLSQWTSSANQEYKDLSQQLLTSFENHKQKLENKKKEKVREQEQKESEVRSETKRINELTKTLEYRKKKHRNPSTLKQITKSKEQKILNISTIEKVLETNKINWSQYLTTLISSKYEVPKLSLFEAKHLKQASQTLNEDVLAFNSLLDTESSEFDASIKYFKELQAGYSRKEAMSVEKWIDHLINRIELPRALPKYWKVKYEEENRIAIVEIQLPDVVHNQLYKTVQLKSGPVEKPLSQKETRELVPNLHPAIMLRVAYEIMKNDESNAIDLLVLNVFVEYHNPSTGNLSTTNTSSVAVKKEQIINLNLSKVDPLTAFSNLKGKSAGKIIEIIPVTPVLTLDRSDARIIDTKAVINELSSDTNLAVMDWQDFENLIAELFQKEFADKGAEVKVTQASRDRGVDAIVYDPNPITGGKYVIQAKRYAHTVDVSAVRDLVAVVSKEGASRGILVTTSNFGSDAYQFA